MRVWQDILDVVITLSTCLNAPTAASRASVVVIVLLAMLVLVVVFFMMTDELAQQCGFAGSVEAQHDRLEADGMMVSWQPEP